MGCELALYALGIAAVAVLAWSLGDAAGAKAGAASLTERQRGVLSSLAWRAERDPLAWWRPMDLGGRDSSHHSATLRALVRKGIVERRRRYVGVSGGPWVYRLSVDSLANLHSIVGRAEGIGGRKPDR